MPTRSGGASCAGSASVGAADQERSGDGRGYVVAALEATLLNNLHTDGFTLKLGSFGKFSVRHKPAICRKVGFSGQTILTKPLRKVKFISLGSLRQREQVD
jgi:nucleoid DNA-binding protein